MPDPASDLYSFLQSKEFSIPDQRSPDSEDSGPRLRALDEFENDDDHSGSDDSSHSLSFEADNVGEQLRQADPETLNSAGFGIIRVDNSGIVRFFNTYESELSGISPSDAKGENFFNELAPCSNNRLFRGRFKEGVRSGEMDERFSYTYTYKMRPTLVEVRLCRDDEGQNWILVQKR